MHGLISQPGASTRPRLLAVVLILALWLCPGCYHFRVTAPDPTPATEYRHETVHALFWGLIQQDTPATNCVSNALDEVKVTTNLGYALVTVATLGIWTPMQVAWRCAKEPVVDGEL